MTAQLEKSKGEKFQDFLDRLGVLQIHLFVNDVTPDQSMKAGDLKELVGFGYKPRTILKENWEWTGNGASVRKEFKTFGPAGAIYGHYITDSHGRLIMAERFANAPLLLNPVKDMLWTNVKVNIVGER